MVGSAHIGWLKIGAAAIALAPLLAACATPIPQVLTKRDVPEKFTGPIVSMAHVWPAPGWWRDFGDPQLTALIGQAQTNNLDLEAALARIDEARAQVTIQRSAFFPQVGLNGEGARAGGAGAFSSGGGTGTGSGTGTTPGAGTTGISSSGNTFQLDLGATYELDFWGLERDNLHAAKEALKSARFAQEALTLSVTANVADTYLSVLALRSRIAIAKENIDAINAILKVIKLKVSSGASSHLDLAQEEAQVEAVEAQLPLLQQQEQEAAYTLAVLLGEPPEKFAAGGKDLDHVEEPVVGPGLPSSLLLRRPDVAQAEANLASAHANVNAARAAFLPQISLTGDAGLISASAGLLFTGPAFAWSYGAELLQTVFDGGKLIGQKDLAEATQKELIADYRKAALSAFSDVETALVDVASNGAQEDHLAREIKAANEAFQISELQYREGTGELLNVLQAQQTLFGAEDQKVQIRLARLQAVVHLYQALGGGWQEQPEDRTQTEIVAASASAAAADRH